MFNLDNSTMIWHARLEGELTIYHAFELYQALSSANMGEAPLDLDLGQVSLVDSSGVQLLVLLKKVFARHHQELRIVTCSEAVKDAVGLFGLNGFFGLTAVPVTKGTSE
ncbi:hypothetical protein CWE12_02640 [Aliidiomarina sedimenti]|uniref:STAS domain-containing protein n=1 Tax=Aliidiomarina sedimenti TaxID=1933879 RepID=A0ABY0C2S7_9GAMM|nr:STAS domain-containing protein [Aliidiomarina sedimenti]RUO31913.1 hypothetical protein CWE12_02640 [Aliidiomarina sedimenti]